MNSDKSLNQKSIGIPKWILIAWIIIAIVGFIDSTYLAVSHYKGTTTTCSLTQKCDMVLTSEWSEIAGIPVALGGVAYYLFMLAGAVYYVSKKNDKLFRLFATFSVMGLLTSAWLVYLMKYVIEAYCQYCLLSAISSTLLFILGMTVLKKYKDLNKINDQLQRNN